MAEKKDYADRVPTHDVYAYRLYSVLAILNIVASSLYFDAEYFTWWSFQVNLILVLTAAFNLLTTPLCYFCFYDSLFVCIGVFTMSVMRSEDNSDMLTQVATQHGLVVYGLQTFAVGGGGGNPGPERR